MLFHRSSRIYLTELSVPPDCINHHSSTSTFFEKVLLQQQRTRTAGPKSLAKAEREANNKHRLL